MSETREPNRGNPFSVVGQLLCLATVYLAFVALAPWGFSTLANVKAMALDSIFTAVAALGAALVIASGGMDVSAGPAMALASAAALWLLNQGGVADPLAALGGVAAAGVVGLVNGCVVSRLRVTPVAITLGTMLATSGIAAWLLESVNGPDASLVARRAAAVGPWSWPAIAAGAAALAALAAVVLRMTVLGRHLLATGSNEATARLCGVRVDELKMLVYTVGGLFAGVAGVMQAHAPAPAGAPVAVGSLDIVAAAVIGGGSLSGGQGSVVGTVIGAMVMTVFRTGCAQMGASEPARQVMAGIVVLAVVGFDRLRHRHDTSN